MKSFSIILISIFTSTTLAQNAYKTKIDLKRKQCSTINVYDRLQTSIKVSNQVIDNRDTNTCYAHSASDLLDFEFLSQNPQTNQFEIPEKYLAILYKLSIGARVKVDTVKCLDSGYCGLTLEAFEKYGGHVCNRLNDPKILNKLIEFSRNHRTDEIKVFLKNLCRNEKLPLEKKHYTNKAPQRNSTNVYDKILESDGGTPISISIEGSLSRTSRFQSSTSGHVLTIVGRKFNENARECEYLLKDSYGTRKNYNGYGWITSQKLQKEVIEYSYFATSKKHI